MVVLILECVPTSLRGELSRWMIEPHAGVFVGSVSGMVRDKLWEKVTKSVLDGGAVLVHSSNTEQGFAIRVHGRTRRKVVDFDGLVLVSLPGVGDSGSDSRGWVGSGDGEVEELDASARAKRLRGCAVK